MASALPKVNWTQLTAPLRSETVAAIAAVRGRNVELFKQIETLQAQDSSIDFSAFRSSIADSKIVDQAEQAFKSFKPKSYDITAQLNELKKGEELAVCISFLFAVFRLFVYRWFYILYFIDHILSYHII